MPIYLVKIADKETLVDANNRAQAIAHTIRGMATAKPLSPREVVSYMKAGADVETALPQDTNTEQPDLLVKE